MTLWAPNPWGQVINGQAPELERRIGFAHPDLEDVAVAAVGRSVWVSVAGAPTDSVWRVAGVLADMWPGWLDELGVSLVVAVAGERWRASEAAMVALAGGSVDRAGWLAFVERVGD